MMEKGYVIAIDGPVASGKGTIAPLLAERLEGFYLQTGAMYRAVAYYCFEKGIDIHNDDNVIAALPNIHISFIKNKTFLNGIDVTYSLLTEDVSYGSSVVARIPAVRKYLIEKQQQIAREKVEGGTVVVAEGRDTATRVFPNARVAIFLTATSEVRARRRQRQIELRTGKEIAFEKMLSDVEDRDKQDRERVVDPLVSEPEKYGYIVIDNSTLSEDEALEEILSKLREKGLKL